MLTGSLGDSLKCTLLSASVFEFEIGNSLY